MFHSIDPRRNTERKGLGEDRKTRGQENTKREREGEGGKGRERKGEKGNVWKVVASRRNEEADRGRKDGTKRQEEERRVM